MDARDLEVRCSGCGAGFAIGTQRCVHCGGVLGSGGGALSMSTHGEPAADDASAENAQRLTSVLSGGVMLAVVLVSWLIRACS